MKDSSAIQLLGQRRFWPLLIAQSFGAFNDNVFKYSMIILITFGALGVDGIPRDVLVPIAATMFTLPIFLFSAIAGQLSDRYPRDLILKHAKLAEIVLMLFAALGFILNSALILFVTLFFMGAQSAIFAPAKLAALPHYLSRKELMPGNAMISGTLFLSILIGSLVGILLIQRPIGPQIIGGTLIALSIMGWLIMQLLPTKETNRPDIKLNWNVVIGTWRTIANLLAEPRALRPLLGIAWFWTASAASVTVMPLFVHDMIYMDETVVSVFMAVFTIGAAFGSLGCALATRNRDILWVSIIGALLLSLFAADVMFASAGREPAALGGLGVFFANKQNWRLLFDFFAMSAFAGVFVVPLQAMSQHRAPEASRARILAGGAVLNAAGASLGQMALITVTRMHLPLSMVYVGIALFSLLFAAFMAYKRIKNTW